MKKLFRDRRAAILRKKQVRSTAKRSMHLEPLEARQLFARDAAFSGVGSLSFSMAPDGTTVGQHQSELFGSLNPLGDWEQAIARAFQKWASHSNVNFGAVEDSGVASGVYGPTRGDDRFGDVRITGFDYNTDTFAEAVSELTRSVGTWAGDVMFNTQANWGSINNFEAAALHEIGHVLGLQHSDNPLSPMHTHGPSGALDLIAEDIANLQAIHGPRRQDSNEGGNGNGNDSIDRASKIKGSSDDTTVADGFNGTQVWIQFGDLTTTGDRDVYLIKTALGYTGPLAVEVNSLGLSLAKLKVSLTDRNGTVLSSGLVDGPMGGKFLLQIPTSNSDGKYYLQVEPTTDAFWAVGIIA